MDRVVVIAMGAILLAGCRGCGDDGGGAVARDGGKAQPTMPVGMLMTSEAGAGASASASESGAGAGAGAGAMRVTRGVKGGAWTELQVAAGGDSPERRTFEHWRDDSRFVSLEAMTLLHEAFARALPGFDLFLPRLYGPEALTRLAAELSAFEKRSTGDISATAREIAALATELAAKHQSLWVLGP